MSAAFGGAVTAIWLREVRGRMRGKRAFIFITIYLAVLGGILWMGIRGVTELTMLSALDSASAGRGIFTAVVLVETLVVVALAPAYTAGVVSSEREKQTFDLLAVTPISSFAIVLGKLASSLSYLLLIVGVSVPLASLSFIFGGLGVETVVLAYGVLALFAVGVGSIGVACSALMRRTQAATVASYIVVGLIVVGATAAWFYLREQDRQDIAVNPPPRVLIELNPFVAMSDILCVTTASSCMEGVTAPGFDFDPETGMGVPQQGPDAPVPGHLWPRSVLGWAVVAAVALFVATQSVSPTRRWSPVRGRTAAPAEPEPQG